MSIKVILVENDKSYREGIKRQLEMEQTIKVVAGVEDVKKLPELIKRYKPDVILIDINTYADDGKVIVERVLSMRQRINVINLSIDDSDESVTKCIKMGVKGFLLKEIDSRILIEAIEVVSEGGFYLHPKITHNILNNYRRIIDKNHTSEPKKVRKPTHLLTGRECEILQLLADGNSNKSIAELLFISEKTVKNHVSSILEKMNVNDRTQAVVEAIRNSWVEIK